MNYYNISDSIIRLKLAYKWHLSSVKINKNKYTVEFIYVLQKIGLIRGFFFLEHSDYILVYLKYTNGRPGIFNIDIMSKPSRRINWTLNYLSKNFKRYDFSTIYIISTPKGLLTNTDILLRKNFSGEVICKIKI